MPHVQDLIYTELELCPIRLKLVKRLNTNISMLNRIFVVQPLVHHNILNVKSRHNDPPKPIFFQNFSQNMCKR